MALIDSTAWRGEARRGLVRALKWTADLLRDDVPVAAGEAFSAARAAPVPPPAPPSVAQPAGDSASARVGAARYVDEHQREDEPVAEPDPVDDALLMGGLSGNLGPALAERVQAEQASEPGGPLHDAIIDALHTIYDPEIPVDIYELGLIYAVEIHEGEHVLVRMTLTSPNCPAAQSLPSEVEAKVEAVPGVASAEVEVVFEPTWTPDLMSEEARLELNLM